MSAVVAAGRGVAEVLRAQSAPVGTFTVRRALPERTRHAVGPWVFLDHFGPFRVRPGHDGVGAHPHAGIETVTYLLAGRQEHRDSAGHTGVVAAGGAQWMTAGRGVVHAERPIAATPEEATLHGIQLWTSLPRLQKLAAPAYQRLDAEAIAEVRAPGSLLRVVAGELGGARGPAVLRMPLVLAHLRLDPGASFAGGVPDAFEMGAYVIGGEGRFGDGERAAAAGELAVFADGAGAVRVANAGPEPLDVMLLGGEAAEGPLVFHGPFVMNSVDQVRAADVAYRTGRMGTLDE